METNEHTIAQLIEHVDEAIAICEEILAICNKSDDTTETKE